MSTRPTSPKISSGRIQKLEAGALDFYSGLSFVDVTTGDLCSSTDVNLGNGTDFPLTAANKAACVQYLREVKQLSWSATYNYDDGAGRVESASESGTHYLAPLGYDENSVPSLPGLEHRRQMMRDYGAIGLALRPDDFESFYVTVPDAITRENSRGPLTPADLELRFILFGNLNSFDRFTNIAHDPATGEYYPKLYFSITGGRGIAFTYSDSANVGGTATVEDLGSCNLYTASPHSSFSFSATIASRF